MSKIKSKENIPEIYVRRLLFHKGVRYYKNYSGLTGRPDIYISRYKTAIFINGCFWHQHKGCKLAYQPSTNKSKWEKKFTENQNRDAKIQKQLQEDGVKILVIWECTIKQMKKKPQIESLVVDEIMNFITNDKELWLEI